MTTRDQFLDAIQGHSRGLLIDDDRSVGGEVKGTHFVVMDSCTIVMGVAPHPADPTLVMPTLFLSLDMGNGVTEKVSLGLGTPDVVEKLFSAIAHGFNTGYWGAAMFDNPTGKHPIRQNVDDNIDKAERHKQTN